MMATHDCPQCGQDMRLPADIRALRAEAEQQTRFHTLWKARAQDAEAHLALLRAVALAAEDIVYELGDAPLQRWEHKLKESLESLSRAWPEWRKT